MTPIGPGAGSSASNRLLEDPRLAWTLLSPTTPQCTFAFSFYRIPSPSRCASYSFGWGRRDGRADSVRGELKALDVAGEDGDLRSFDPADHEYFVVHVTAIVGPAGQEGEELFQFTICSPRWFADQPLQKGFAFQRHTLFLERWDPGLVERAIQDLCRRTEGNTWNEVALKLSQYGHWEFEDYRE